MAFCTLYVLSFDEDAEVEGETSFERSAGAAALGERGGRHVGPGGGGRGPVPGVPERHAGLDPTRKRDGQASDGKEAAEEREERSNSRKPRTPPGWPCLCLEPAAETWPHSHE